MEITHQILGRQNTINEVMNIGFITIMQTLYIELMNEFPREKKLEKE